MPKLKPPIPANHNGAPEPSGPELLSAVLEHVLRQLEPLIERTMARVLSEHAQAEVPRRSLLTIDELCAELGLSRSKIYELRNDGMPCILIGDSPRFEREAALEWLRAHHGTPR